jgi:GNAT superfamily N-acetyltransferase
MNGPSSVPAGIPLTAPHGHPLAALVAAAAHGSFPAADGTLAVVPAPTPYRGAVVAFTAHSLVAVDLPADEVHAHLPAGDLGAPMAAPFLAWLGQRLEAAPGMLDVVLVHLGTSMGGVPLVPSAQGQDHPRVARARRQRQGVEVYTEPQERGMVTLGRGLVGRWEISLELAPAARGRGLGRAMIAAARALLPADEPVFAQVAPGNAQSLRAFLAAGFRPIGSEVLFP